MRNVKVAWPIGGWPAVATEAGGSGRLRVHGRFAIAIVAAFCGVACLLIPAARAAETLHPATALQDVKAVAAEDYYILLLKWTRNVVVKGVTARVVYLDPPLYLAWLKQANPDVTQAQFAKALAGFPRVLSFRIAYDAASRNLLDAPSWKVAMLGENGKREKAKSAHRVAPPSLESNANGTYWQEQWLYTFAVPASFLTAETKGFGIALDGPDGSGTARWQFGAVRVAATHPDAYVPYLGLALLALSGLVIAGLVLTRRPTRSSS